MVEGQTKQQGGKRWLTWAGSWCLMGAVVASVPGAEEPLWRPATGKAGKVVLPQFGPSSASPMLPPVASLPPHEQIPRLPTTPGDPPASESLVPSLPPAGLPLDRVEEPMWRPASPRRPVPAAQEQGSLPVQTLPPANTFVEPDKGSSAPLFPSEKSPPPTASKTAGDQPSAGEPPPMPLTPPTSPPIPPRIPPADSPPEKTGSPPLSLPPPRRMPTVSPATAEWPVAPPELLVPEHLPVQARTFGSLPLRISRDYPSLAELCGSTLAWPFGPRDRFHIPDEVDWPVAYVQAEYLLWWVSPLNIPVLATTNPDPSRFGYLNEPGTVPIVGPGALIGPFRDGLRVRTGLWDAARSCALDGSFFFLGRRTASMVVDSQQFPIITRPVFSPNPRPGNSGVIGETGEAVAVPNILRGQFRVDASSLLWGMDANLRCCLRTTEEGQLTGLVGYRYLNLSEALEMKENVVVIGPGGTRLNVPDPPGTIVFVRDRFAVENRFHGGQVGFTWERRWGAWTLWGRATIAFGITEQELEIYGIQTRIRPNQPPVSYPGGLLAAASNLGTFHLDRFSVVPEVTVQLGYRLSPAWQIYLGYNFLYWTNVLRPGEQIDRVVDLTQVPNAPSVPFSGQFRPRPLFRQSDLLVTGLQFGLEWRW